ncbi:MAG: ABC-2 transporter permease [Clostridiaceae bacterium]|nr:ABC-2 transporter permease [Clostridiaceae bacterium]
MKGLILKDLLQLKTYSKSLMLIFVFFTIISFTNNNPSFASVSIIVLSCMMVITSFAYDNIGKWDGFALCTPIKRNQIVFSKYALALLLVFFGTVISFISTYIFTIVKKVEFGMEAAVTIGVGLEVAIILISIMMPLIYIFGVEKSRYIFMIVVLIPTLMGVFGIGVPNYNILLILLKFSPVFTILVFMLSYFISSAVFDKKEF